MSGSAALHDRLADHVRADPLLWSLLTHVRAAGPPGAWVAAGAIRDSVWSRLHGQPLPDMPPRDVDVVWFDAEQADSGADTLWEAALVARCPAVRWSVKNQAHMHRRHGHAPYGGVEDAMRMWPETATAIAARRTECGGLDIAAPHGLDDLFALRLRPPGGDAARLWPVLAKRAADRQWLARFPSLVVMDQAES